MRKMFALVSNQGAAMFETALCETCASDDHKRKVAIADAANNADVDDPWNGDEEFQDCTSNEELVCFSCGYRTQFAALRNAEGEVVVQLASGWTLRSGCSDDKGFVSGEYVRLCTPDGEEHLYWDNAEWHDEPILVMGAIINSAAGVVLEPQQKSDAIALTIYQAMTRATTDPASVTTDVATSYAESILARLS